MAKARIDFADLLDSLSEDQLNTQSLCSEWRVIDVAGHLTSLVELSGFQFVKGIAKAKGNADLFLSTVAKEFAGRGAEELSSSLRHNADKAMRPFSEASMASDTAVHTLDVLRPLGADLTIDPEVLTMSLNVSADEFAKKFNNTTAPRFESSTSDWSWGVGPVVTGPSELLLLAMNNRDVAGELDGEGVALLSAPD